MFDSDTAVKSSCADACTVYWPPLIAKGKASVAGSAKAADLGTITRAGGTKQVTYDGHPLYYFIGDHTAGDTGGQGLDDFGAKWWLLGPSGSPITSGSSSGGSSGSSGGYGGYGG
jgi:predicted lipoprotein with Yx(FWY)xxD motif